MEIILKQDVANLGSKDDIVKVKNGYANNYLVPYGYASIATASAKKVHAETQRQRAHKLEQIKADAATLATSLEGVTLTIGAKASTTGKIFGSVNTIQISEALKAKGFDVDRKQITISDAQIKELGKYSAEVKLHRDVKVKIDFEVVEE
ncbi:MAG: 50S ribosomal protein L9 [Prevotellaceae bacterium]|jgi:large subunit ribosomal protein L9|nr:50S ribosomal protein L9 [Prevotellaceae bacterium]